MKEFEKEINKLNKEQYEVTQNNKTETPYDNAYNDHFEEGIYVDVISKEVLFTSKEKFDAGCGWPSFTKPASDENIEELPDFSHGLKRTEVKSKKAKSHLGHVFDDGPDGNLRYCINSASLEFIPKKDMAKKGYEEYLKLFE
ncbi:MAG: peptide-methionine (R)-S-oxide reductase MsrB [Candidatus Izimaplasma sp.]|nr:peptide-methionine (R)-S-oxide reductase MsrB [Candidatus Izimaplasma bacterium]